jgi:hypothetical protein
VKETETKIIEVMVIQRDRHASVEADHGFDGVGRGNRGGGGGGTFQRSCREDQTNEVTRIKKEEWER